MAAIELPAAITPAWLRSFRARLQRWHLRAGRSLPWRGADAYRVWVSEIMLQQTTVAAVIPYYERFLAALPTVAALAAAEEQQVLRLWEGLGYYSRARNLHRAAQLVMQQHGGRLPEEVEVLQSLPGIGRYTAGAIASFGYGRRAPIVEANTLRLYTRLLDFDGDPRSAAGQRLLWDFAERLLPREHAGEFNQALTDLGAKVCVPAEPRCESCPALSLCGAARSGRQRELPRAVSRPDLTDIVECAVVVEQTGRYLLRRCQPGERWAGLWDFPRFPIDPTLVESPAATKASIDRRLMRFAANEVARMTGVKPRITACFVDLRHGVTRYRIRLIGLRATGQPARTEGDPAEIGWFTTAELQSLPLSTTGRKLASRLSQ